MRYPRNIRFPGILQNLLGDEYTVIEEGCNGRTTIQDDPIDGWKNGLDYLISVDGGMNRETGRRCADAGADVLAAGSYLFRMEDMAPEIDIWHSF